jgi:hypothetical protein
MRYQVASEHRSFFSKHGTIDFEELLNSKEMECLKKALSTAVNKRDLWRQSTEAAKIILSQKCAQIAAELVGLKVLRIAFDLELQAGTLPTGSTTLQSMSCLQPVVCGLMLDLNSGKGTFIAPDFSLAPHLRDQKLLIAYGGEKLLYTHNPSDPYTHLLKREGYVFGDLVKTSTNPLVYF